MRTKYVRQKLELNRKVVLVDYQVQIYRLQMTPINP